MRKVYLVFFEYWKRFGFINLIQSVYVCVELWVNRTRRELRPRGLKLNVLFPSVWKPWEQFYRQIKRSELNCLYKCMLAVLMRGKSWGKLITADHPWQTIHKRESDLTPLDNHNHHCLCIQHRLWFSLQSLLNSCNKFMAMSIISQNISQKVLYLTKPAKYNKKRPFIFGTWD